MISFDELKTQIKENSCVRIPFPVLRPDFNKAIDHFVHFLSLPMEKKREIFFKARQDERGAEVGYVRYLRDYGHTDNREYFHYHHLAEERFSNLRTDIPELDELLKSMKFIYGETVKSLEEILVTLDKHFPGIHRNFFTEENGRGDFYLRFLKYDYAKPGEFLAKGHYDRGGCTLALAESAPGLRMGIDDEHMKEVEHLEGEALFMPALKFSTLTSNDFPPTWHDVVQKGDDTYNGEIARWAIVFFANPVNVPEITYEEAHTPRRQSVNL